MKKPLITARIKPNVAILCLCALLAIVLPAALLSSSPAAPAATQRAAIAATPASTIAQTPPATPLPSHADPVRTIIDGMSDEELLGQMIMLGFSGRSDMKEEEAALAARYKVGGFILFGWNTSTFPQTEKLIQNVKTHNPYPALPLFIALDAEGGRVSRLKWSPPLKSAEKLGKMDDPQAVYDQFLRVGQGLKRVGVNLNFAPVLDMSGNPQGNLENRIYGGTPEKVIPLTTMAIRGLREGGVVAVGKHFPGLGATATDSHKKLPVIGTTKEQLFGFTFKPFEAAVDEGIEAMMMGHLMAPAIDDQNPASLSKTFITDILRGEIGFKGVIFSDDMRMGAITSHYEIGEACIRYIEAGGDVVLIGKYFGKQTAALQALEGAVKSGRITRARLEESAYRIIALKLRIEN